MLCTLCRKNEVPSGRWDLGIRYCLPCGDTLSAKETAAKAKRVTLAYSKGPYMYAGAPEDAKRNIQDSTDRRRIVEAPVESILPVRVARELNRTPTKTRPVAIGIYYAPGEKNGTFYYTEDDPHLKTAARKMRFDGK